MPKGNLLQRPIATPEFISRQVRSGQHYYLNLSPGYPKGIVVVCGGLEHCREDYIIDRSNFPFLVIEYVIAGKGTVTLSGKSQPLHEAAIYAYFPRQRHIIQSDAQQPLTKYYVAIAGERIEQLVRKSPLIHGVIRTLRGEEILSLFEQLQLYASQASPQSPRLCALLVEVLVLKIKETSSQKEGPESEAFASYQFARQTIQENFLKLHNLNEVALACGVTTNYLCRLFQRFDQETGYQFLIRTKMNHAASLLTDSSTTVVSVAEKLGYSDPFHFSRVFKRIHGISPESFRKLH